jgi:16S rRNA (adenine1518-N6/adenine1519-N6)-dimethyltransferase
MLTPTELKALCETYRLSPSKAYGQNYLIQPKPIRDMLAAGELVSTDTVIEVGPGFGVLTLPLVEQVQKVYSFEIEQKLREYWEDKMLNIKDKNLEIIWGNALHAFPLLVSTVPPRYKILANVPYQITSQLIQMFLEADPAPERIVVMVQREVAERICAKPGDMSLLAVSVQYYGTPKIISIVSKGNFFPSPKVDSAIIAITNIHSEPNAEHFFEVVRAGFSNKRKQLANNLSAALHIDRAEVQRILLTVCGSETVRAQELTIDMWKMLTTALPYATK